MTTIYTDRYGIFADTFGRCATADDVVQNWCAMHDTDALPDFLTEIPEPWMIARDVTPDGSAPAGVAV